MGVHGLWDLLSPAGTTCDLKSLRHQTVAVDASIWMFHFVKAIRDKDGNMVEGAHILGFFRRIVRLLHLGIRPIFVFDGPPPEVKKRTLRQRQLQREQGGLNLQKVTEKLFRNLLREEVLREGGNGLEVEDMEMDVEGEGSREGAKNKKTGSDRDVGVGPNGGSKKAKPAKGKAISAPADVTKDLEASAKIDVPTAAEELSSSEDEEVSVMITDQEDDLLADEDAPKVRRKVRLRRNKKNRTTAAGIAGTSRRKQDHKAIAKAGGTPLGGKFPVTDANEKEAASRQRKGVDQHQRVAPPSASSSGSSGAASSRDDALARSAHATQGKANAKSKASRTKVSSSTSWLADDMPFFEEHVEIDDDGGTGLQQEFRVAAAARSKQLQETETRSGLMEDACNFMIEEEEDDEDDDIEIELDPSAAPAASTDTAWERRKKQRGYGLGVSVGQTNLGADVTVSDEVLKKYLLKMPENITQTGDETKGYEIEGPDGTKRLVTLPLGTLVDPEVFDKLDPLKRYETLTNLIDAWMTETRVKAMECRNAREAFSSVQLETFYRHIRTNKLLEETKLELAKARGRDGAAASSGLLGDEGSGNSGTGTANKGNGKNPAPGLELNEGGGGALSSSAGGENVATFLNKLRPIAAGFASTLRTGKKGKGKGKNDGESSGGGGGKMNYKAGGAGGEKDAGGKRKGAGNFLWRIGREKDKAAAGVEKEGKGGTDGDASVNASGHGYGKKGYKKGKGARAEGDGIEENAALPMADALSAQNSTTGAPGQHQSMPGLGGRRMKRGKHQQAVIYGQEDPSTMTFGDEGFDIKQLLRLNQVQVEDVSPNNDSGGSALKRQRVNRDWDADLFDDEDEHEVAGDAQYCQRENQEPCTMAIRSRCEVRVKEEQDEDDSIMAAVKVEEESDISHTTFTATASTTAATFTAFSQPNWIEPSASASAAASMVFLEEDDPLNDALFGDGEMDDVDAAQEIRNLLPTEQDPDVPSASAAAAGVHIKLEPQDDHHHEQVPSADLHADDAIANPRELGLDDFEFDDETIKKRMEVGVSSPEAGGQLKVKRDDEKHKNIESERQEHEVAAGRVPAVDGDEPPEDDGFREAEDENAMRKAEVNDSPVPANKRESPSPQIPASAQQIDGSGFTVGVAAEDAKKASEARSFSAASPASGKNYAVDVGAATATTAETSMAPSSTSSSSSSTSTGTTNNANAARTTSTSNTAGAVGTGTETAPSALAIAPAAGAATSQFTVAPAVSQFTSSSASAFARFGGATTTSTFGAPSQFGSSFGFGSSTSTSQFGGATSRFVSSTSSTFGNFKVFDPTKFVPAFGAGAAIGTAPAASFASVQQPQSFGGVPAATSATAAQQKNAPAPAAAAGTTSSSSNFQSATPTATSAAGTFMNTSKQLDSLEAAVDEVFGPSVPGVNADHLVSDLRAELHKAKRDEEFISQDMYDDIKKLLYAFAVPYVEAPSEAEAQCAFLVEAKLATCVVSDDSDVVVFSSKSGSTRVYRHLFSSKGDAEKYTSYNIGQQLGLAYDDLIALAMLLGCDYTMGVKGIGIVNALEILEAFGQKKYLAPEEDEEPPKVVALEDVENRVEEVDLDVERAVAATSSGTTAPAAGKNQQEQADPKPNPNFHWLTELRHLREWAQDVANFDNKAHFDREKVTEDFHVKHRALRPYWVFPHDFPSREVWDAFMNPVIDHSREKFEWGTVDVEAITTIVGRYMTDALVLRTLDLEKLSEMQKEQKREDLLRTWFSVEEEQSIALVHSKRLKLAIRKMKGLKGVDEDADAVAAEQQLKAASQDGGTATAGGTSSQMRGGTRANSRGNGKAKQSRASKAAPAAGKRKANAKDGKAKAAEGQEDEKAGGSASAFEDIRFGRPTSDPELPPEGTHGHSTDDEFAAQRKQNPSLFELLAGGGEPGPGHGGGGDIEDAVVKGTRKRAKAKQASVKANPKAKAKASAKNKSVSAANTKGRSENFVVGDETGIQEGESVENVEKNVGAPPPAPASSPAVRPAASTSGSASGEQPEKSNDAAPAAPTANVVVETTSMKKARGQQEQGDHEAGKAKAKARAAAAKPKGLPEPVFHPRKKAKK